MSSFIDDVLGTPRRRTKSHGRSPLSTPPLQRATSPDIFHSALAVPTRASLAQSSSSSSATAAAPQGEVGGGGGAVKEKELESGGVVELSTAGEVPVVAEVDGAGTGTEVREKEEGSIPVAEVEGQGSEVPAKDAETEPDTLHIIQEPLPIVHATPAILIGIAGCTSSGKSVLSRVLESVLPPSTPRFVIHQNDFFVPEHLLVPSGSDGKLDADCREAVDFKSLARVMKYAKREGGLPPGFRTRQDETYDLEQVRGMVNEATIDELKILLADSAVLEEGQPVGIVDGFLLYSEPEIRGLLDVKLFLRTTKDKAGIRRFEKLEGVGGGAGEDFWMTREYFDTMVWPNYILEHASLFRDGNVEGEPLFDLCEGLAISMQPELEMKAEEIVRWAVNTIVGRLRALSLGQSRSLDPEEVLPGKYELCNCGDGWIGHVRRFLCEHV
ncbi:MAG: hypothetical protein Q9191_001476 [Dirinaria sp. TL-2023a]